MAAKVSVIIPVYNVKDFLQQCISSVINQTFKDIEIICVEDASTDGSKELLEQISKTDDRIKVVFNNKNLGLSASRNIGIKFAKANYLMFLDSDDYYLPNMVELMFNAIEKNNVDVAACNVEVFYENFNEQKKTDEVYFKNPYRGFRRLNPEVIAKISNVVAWNKIYKRKLINENNILFPDGLLYESYPFWGAYCAVANSIYFIDTPLYKYRRRDGGIMAKTFNKDSRSIDYVNSVIFLYDWLKREGHWDNYQWNFFRLFIFCAKAALNYSLEEEKKVIIETIAKFLSKIEYTETDVGPRTYRTLEFYRVCLNNNSKKKKILSKIVYHDYDEFRLFSIPLLKDIYFPKRKIKVCGIPFLKIEQRSGYKKIKLFGVLPVWYKFENKTQMQSKICSILTSVVPNKEKKIKWFKSLTRKLFIDKVNLNVATNTIPLLQFDNQRLLSELKNMEPFVYIPNPGNMGDCLIAKGTYNFFEKYNIKYEIKTNKNEKVENLVYGGGGIWVKNIYSHAYKETLNIMKKAKRVVILPSSIYECNDLIEILDERFTVFCRDNYTYEYLKEQSTGAKVYLDHDMALRISPESLHGLVNLTLEKKLLLNRLKQKLKYHGNVGFFFRTDKERKHYNPSDLDLSLVFGSRSMDLDDVNFATFLILSIVDMYDVVVTDRLHVGIAAILMQKEVYLLDNNYKKISGVYNNSLHRLPNVHFCNKLPSDFILSGGSNNDFKLKVEEILC